MTQPVTPEAGSLEAAILRTLLYADVFNFPLTVAELHHFLIGYATTPAQIEIALKKSAWLSGQITQGNGYYTLRDRSEIIAQRLTREAASQKLWPIAIRYVSILAQLPFVRMIALTGALAMRNANTPNDDIDYLVVTAPGRVWLTRALVVLIVRLARWRGVEICPNYVLATTALEQNKRDLFIAHELAQMIPMMGLAIYQQMRQVNRWMQPMLPNADAPFYAVSEIQPQGAGRILKHFGEFMLSGPIGNFLENWEKRRKLRKFAGEARNPTSSAQLDAQQVKGHFNDHGWSILKGYSERLARYNLEEHTPSLAMSEQPERIR